MFQHLVRNTGGGIPVLIGTGPPAGAVGSQGFLINPATGEIHASNGGTPVHYNGGLAFDVDGRLILDDALVNFSNSYPVGLNGGPVIVQAAITLYNQGIGYANSGAMASVGAVAQGAFSAGFSDGFDV